MAEEQTPFLHHANENPHPDRVAEVEAQRERDLRDVERVLDALTETTMELEAQRARLANPGALLDHTTRESLFRLGMAMGLPMGRGA